MKILICGLPGSGKTTLAEPKIREQLRKEGKLDWYRKIYNRKQYA